MGSPPHPRTAERAELPGRLVSALGLGVRPVPGRICEQGGNLTLRSISDVPQRLTMETGQSYGREAWEGTQAGRPAPEVALISSSLVSSFWLTWV